LHVPAVLYAAARRVPVAHLDHSAPCDRAPGPAYSL